MKVDYFINLYQNVVNELINTQEIFEEMFDQYNLENCFFELYDKIDNDIWELEKTIKILNELV